MKKLHHIFPEKLSEKLLEKLWNFENAHGENLEDFFYVSILWKAIEGFFEEFLDKL